MNNMYCCTVYMVGKSEHIHVRTEKLRISLVHGIFYSCIMAKAIQNTLECLGNLTNAFYLISYSLLMISESVVGIFRKILSLTA